MTDETAASRIPFVFVLSLLVALVMSAVWTTRAAIQRHATRFVQQEWQQRLTADIERGIREARSCEQEHRQR